MSDIKWEYRVEYLAHRGTEEIIPGGRYAWEVDLETTLNKLGDEGWEIVSFPKSILGKYADGYALLKRAKKAHQE